MKEREGERRKKKEREGKPAARTQREASEHASVEWEIVDVHTRSKSGYFLSE